MSVFPNAQHTRIYDGTLTAIGGNQNTHAGGSVTIVGHNYISGNQNNYHGLSSKGVLPHLLCLI